MFNSFVFQDLYREDTPPVTESYLNNMEELNS